MSHHNILIDSKDDVKVCDFGLSKRLRKLDSKFLTVCGKLGYMAPEINRNMSYSLEVDMFSLGILIYYVWNESEIYNGMILIDYLNSGKTLPIP